MARDDWKEDAWDEGEWRDDEWELDEPSDELSEDSDDDPVAPTIDCPYCQAEIHEDSVRCPFCEQYLSQEDSPGDAKPYWVVLGVVLCLLLVLLWVLPWY